MIHFSKMKQKKLVYGDLGWKIKVDKQSVGSIYATIIMHNKNKCFGIQWITISKQYRKKGYGRKAVRLLMDIMKKKYTCFIAISVGGPDKEVAKKFWNSLGFTRIRKTNNYLYAKE